MKSVRDTMDIVNAYATLGSYRGAAELCGTTHKTVKRVVERRDREGAAPPSRSGRRDGRGAELVEERVRADRRADQRQAPPAGRAGGRLRRLGAQPRSAR